MKRIDENINSGFEFLAADATNNSVDIYFPFANLANENFSNRGLDIKILESGTIRISFEHMDLIEKKALSQEIIVFLKNSRQHIIDNFLIYKNSGIAYL